MENMSRDLFVKIIEDVISQRFENSQRVNNLIQNRFQINLNDITMMKYYCKSIHFLKKFLKIIIILTQ